MNPLKSTKLRPLSQLIQKVCYTLARGLFEAKSDQSEYFQKILLDTGDKRIVIAGVLERFWGVDVALNGDAAADPTKRTEKNKLGETLKLVYDKLK